MRRMAAGVALGLLVLGACTTVSSVESQSDADRCVQEGGEVQVNSDDETLSCVKQDLFARFDAWLSDLFDNIFLLMLFGGIAIGLVGGGIAWLVERGKRSTS